MNAIRDVQFVGQSDAVMHFLQNCTGGDICEIVYCARRKDRSIRLLYRHKSYIMEPFDWMTLYHDGTIRVSKKRDLTPLPADHAADW